MGASSLAKTLANDVVTVARAILGKPTLRTKRQMRFGSKGSLSVELEGPKRGLWCDFETGDGGDLLDLIQRERGVDFAGAAKIAEGLVGGHFDPHMQRAPKAKPSGKDDATAERVASALTSTWSPVQSLQGTLGEQYFIEQRRLHIAGIEFGHALGWHSGIKALVALMTDPVTSEPCGVHRTFLNADGTKRERKMLGRQGVIRLSPDEDVTAGLGVCEGIEDGLAILLSGWAPIWVATSAGAIARFPVLAGIECLTIFADADDAGQNAAKTCAARWQDAGREAFINTPENRP